MESRLHGNWAHQGPHLPPPFMWGSTSLYYSLKTTPDRDPWESASVCSACLYVKHRCAEVWCREKDVEICTVQCCIHSRNICSICLVWANAPVIILCMPWPQCFLRGLGCQVQTMGESDWWHILGSQHNMLLPPSQEACRYEQGVCLLGHPHPWLTPVAKAKSCGLPSGMCT